MAGATLETQAGFSFFFDLEKLEKRYGAKSVRKAETVSMKRVLKELETRIRMGFQVRGWNPTTGKPRFWPRAVKPRRKGGRVKEGSAKTAKGVVARIRSGGKVLYATGRYQDSIKASDVAMKRDGPEGFIGTNVPYAKYHEQPNNSKGYSVQKATKPQAAFLQRLGFEGVRFGTPIKLPQRRVFVMPRPWKNEFASLYAEELIEILNGAG